MILYGFNSSLVILPSIHHQFFVDSFFNDFRVFLMAVGVFSWNIFKDILPNRWYRFQHDWWWYHGTSSEPIELDWVCIAWRRSWSHAYRVRKSAHRFCHLLWPIHGTPYSYDAKLFQFEVQHLIVDQNCNRTIQYDFNKTDRRTILIISAIGFQHGFTSWMNSGQS